MYVAQVLLLMLVVPLGSMLVESDFLMSRGAPWPLVGKWFVFWGVGVRLTLAGARQALDPRYTAERILGLRTSEAWLVIRELGFANLAIGIVAVGSIHAAGWLTPAAVAGSVFYGLAGCSHLRSRHRNRLESLAMISDIWMFAVLIAYCLATARGA